MRSLERFITCPNHEPITEQICTVGPTRPADPPDPMVMEEVTAQTASTRLRILPFFRTTASMTRSTPFSATASGKYRRVKPMINPPSMGMKGIRKATIPADSPSRRPSPENTHAKKSIIHRNTVDAVPARTPITAARMSRLYSLPKNFLSSVGVRSLVSLMRIDEEVQ